MRLSYSLCVLMCLKYTRQLTDLVKIFEMYGSFTA